MRSDPTEGRPLADKSLLAARGPAAPTVTCPCRDPTIPVPAAERLRRDDDRTARRNRPPPTTSSHDGPTARLRWRAGSAAVELDGRDPPDRTAQPAVLRRGAVRVYVDGGDRSTAAVSTWQAAPSTAMGVGVDRCRRGADGMMQRCSISKSLRSQLVDLMVRYSHAVDAMVRRFRPSSPRTP
jgi:hypothetical protein